jgi:peptidoglycan hydrolase CwlO-like protein
MAASPGYNLAQRGSISTVSIAADNLGSSGGILPSTYRAPPTTPSPPPHPPPQRTVSFTDSNNGGIANPRQLQRSASNGSVKGGKSSSSFSCGQLLLKLYLFALVMLGCTALFFRTLMHSLQYELAVIATSSASSTTQQDNNQQQIQQQQQQLEKEIQVMTNQMKQYEVTHLDLLKQNDDIARKLQTLNTQSFTTQKSILHTTNTIADVTLEVNKYRSLVEGVDSVSDYIQGREETLWKRITNLQSKIIRESQREALEW